ncbi:MULTISPECIES: DUF6783 domain-containing protein [Robinsoniella]
MRGKYAAKWGVQMAGMNFQTRSNIPRNLLYHAWCLMTLSSEIVNNF